jgi:hypothetical protein
MSVTIPFDSVSKEIKEFVSQKYIVQPPPTKFEATPEKVKCYRVNNSTRELIVPFGAGEELFEDESDVFPDELDEHFFINNPSTTIIPFTLKTDPKKTRDQDLVINEAMERLSSHHSVLLGLFTGFGKTTVAIYLAVQLGLKVAVICHIDAVNRRWVSDFQSRTNLKAKLVDASTSLPDGYDVYVLGVQKAANISPEEYSRVGVGTVIVDEIHLCTLTCFTDSLLRIHPRFLIGLSATPDRKDGMHILFDLYFGPGNVILRSETKNFVVVKYKTTFVPTLENIIIKGKPTLKWATAKSSIEENQERWKVICDIAQSHQDRCILILSDLKVQSEGIYNELRLRGENADIFIGTKKSYDPSSRILVGGLKKCGTGFDDPRFNMLILASDMTSVEQAEGRIRCADALIYDLVDDHFLFENHFKKRLEWYTVRGADMKWQRMRNDML